jgi:pSer/pThr/pTyr-binding forkhead associated (FHA) protein
MSIYRLKGASGPVANQSHTLGERTVIGRAVDCDLRLDQSGVGDGVAPHHAEIRQQEGGLTLARLDPAAELVLNGQPVEQAALASGDEIRIANCRFVLQAPGLRPQKVLTEAAVRPRRRFLPWLLVAALLAAAAAAAWYAGLLDFVQR